MEFFKRKKRVTLSNDVLVAHDACKKIMDFLWKGQSNRVMQIEYKFETFSHNEQKWGYVTARVVTTSISEPSLSLEAKLEFRTVYGEVNNRIYWEPYVIVKVTSMEADFILENRPDGIKAHSDKDDAVVSSLFVRLG